MQRDIIHSLHYAQGGHIGLGNKGELHKGAILVGNIEANL